MVGLLPGPASCFSCMSRLTAGSSEKDLKTVGRSARCCDREFVTTAGGNRLMRFSPGVLASNCLAIIRLWAAKASRGESDGGISPSLYCVRGEGRPSLVDGSNGVTPRSMKVGFGAMVLARRVFQEIFRSSQRPLSLIAFVW